MIDQLEAAHLTCAGPIGGRREEEIGQNPTDVPRVLIVAGGRAMVGRRLTRGVGEGLVLTKKPLTFINKISTMEGCGNPEGALIAP